MRALYFKYAAVNVVRDMEKNHTMAFAAALAYYFVLALSTPARSPKDS